MTTMAASLGATATEALRAILVFWLGRTNSEYSFLTTFHVFTISRTAQAAWLPCSHTSLATPVHMHVNMSILHSAHLACLDRPHVYTHVHTHVYKHTSPALMGLITCQASALRVGMPGWLSCTCIRRASGASNVEKCQRTTFHSTFGCVPPRASFSQNVNADLRTCLRMLTRLPAVHICIQTQTRTQEEFASAQEHACTARARAHAHAHTHKPGRARTRES